MSALSAQMVSLADHPHVRDVIVRRFVIGTWSVIVYRSGPVHSIEGKGATLEEAMERACELLLDAAA